MKRRGFSKIITGLLSSIVPNWALGKKVSLTIPGRGCWKASSLDEYLILEQADVDAGARFLYFNTGAKELEGGSYFKVWPEHPRYEEAKSWPFDSYKHSVEESFIIRDMEETMGDWRSSPDDFAKDNRDPSALHPDFKYPKSKNCDSYWKDCQKGWNENSILSQD